jgi:hypothetical protein
MKRDRGDWLLANIGWVGTSGEEGSERMCRGFLSRELPRLHLEPKAITVQ